MKPNRIYESERPLGARTSRKLTNGSPFPVAWLLRDVSEFNDEVVKMHNNTFHPQLANQQLLETINKLFALMNDASAGTCEVGATNQFPSRTLSAAHELLELRPYWDDTDAIRPPRLLRLYYGEPVLDPSGLLPLHLASKPKGPDVLHEQDAAIAEADDRATRWALDKHSRVA